MLSNSRRIFYNILATYGRSLFVLFCGLLTGRWSLMTLGRVDLGLLGLVGGLTAFIAFINNLMAGAIGRFYAYSVGESHSSPESGLEECRKWFNTALLVHTVVPSILVAIGYPIGAYALRHWLTIPADRLEDCIWVFRISCLSCFMGMANVPFYAMYYAKQFIVEFTFYTIASTIFHVCILYYMLTHPGVWLVKYQLANFVYSLLPTTILIFRAAWLFPECKFNYQYLWSLERIKSMLNFAGWQFFGSMGSLLRRQGLAILVNKYFGPAVNASNSIANNLAGHSMTLSVSLSGAFAPAITNACGAKDYTQMRKLAFFTCKVGTLLILIFAVPMILEVDELLVLWLKEPPEFVGGLCVCVMVTMLLDRISYGQMLAVNAMGKIALYQAVLGTSLITTLPIAWFLIEMGLGVYAVGYSMIFTMGVCSIGRVWFARTLTGMSGRYWAVSIAMPLVGIALLGGAAGLLPRLWMSPSFMRVIATSVFTNATIIMFSWLFLLSKEEKVLLREKLRCLLPKVK